MERAFESGLNCPTFVHDSLEIELLDNDKNLIDVIDKAQANEKLKTSLDEIYKSFAKRNKSTSALNHDIGLIEGVKYLRSADNNEKYFILSEEISVNQFSKQAGFKKNLPLSLRVDTLINLLAVNNGGDTFNTEDYVPLFANIIRFGLVPHHDTFRQTELYQFYQMNSKITSLPQNVTKDIVLQLHEEILRGTDDDNLHRDLEELITKGEINVNNQYEATKEELYFKSKENERINQDNDKLKSILRKQIKSTVTKEYDDATQKLRSKCVWKIPLLIVLLSAAVYFVYYAISPSPNFTISTVVSIVFNILSTLISNLFGQFYIVKERQNNRIHYIEEETEKRMTSSVE